MNASPFTLSEIVRGMRSSIQVRGVGKTALRRLMYFQDMDETSLTFLIDSLLENAHQEVAQHHIARPDSDDGNDNSVLLVNNSNDKSIASATAEGRVPAGEEGTRETLDLSKQIEDENLKKSTEKKKGEKTMPAQRKKKQQQSEQHEHDRRKASHAAPPELEVMDVQSDVQCAPAAVQDKCKPATYAKFGCPHCAKQYVRKAWFDSHVAKCRKGMRHTLCSWQLLRCVNIVCCSLLL